MSRLNRRTMLLGASAGMLSACGVGDDLAGGARKQPKGGIGGTGIVGTLIDFGSLIINGLQVVLPPELWIESVMGDQDQSKLAIGQNLTVEAETISGVLLARRVLLVHPLIGPVQSVSGSDLIVAGIPVRVEAGVSQKAAKGDIAVVSGTWNQSELVASRVDRTTDATISVAGTVRYDASGDRWTIGAMPVLLSPDDPATDGGFATATGYLHGNALKVQRYVSGRFTGAAGALTALSVEGYLAPFAQAPFQSIDGLGHSFAEKTELDAYIGNRTLFSGAYDGKFNLSKGLILPDSFAERRRLLRV